MAGCTTVVSCPSAALCLDACLEDETHVRLPYVIAAPETGPKAKQHISVYQQNLQSGDSFLYRHRFQVREIRSKESLPRSREHLWLEFLHGVSQKLCARGFLSRFHSQGLKQCCCQQICPFILSRWGSTVGDNSGDLFLEAVSYCQHTAFGTGLKAVNPGALCLDFLPLQQMQS